MCHQPYFSSEFHYVNYLLNFWVRLSLLVSSFTEWLLRDLCFNISGNVLSHCACVLLKLFGLSTKEHWLFSVLLIQTPCYPKSKIRIHRQFSLQPVLTSDSPSIIVSQISDLCNGNIYCPFN